MIARVSAVTALVLAIVLVALVLLGGGSSYRVHAYFQDASQLVTGDDVLIGPARVGTISSIVLAPNGQAEITLGLNSSAAPLHQGTVARIYETSLTGVANHYIALQPGPPAGPSIPNGGTIPEQNTYSEVNLDQLFDTLDPLTRAGLRNFIRGQATAIQGKAIEANRTLLYLAPGLASTSNVTAELTRDEPAFDGLLVQGAQALQELASRSAELTQLVSNTNTTTAAIASQSQALQQALALFPGALSHSTSTFAGLNTTLDDLDPVVAESKIANRRLEPFAASLRSFANVSIPTVAELNGLIHNPSGGGDLTSLAQLTPSLAREAATVFPELIKQMNESQQQVNYLVDYAPDVVGALTNFGQASAYYDGNGHYARTQPVFWSFGLNGSNQLTFTPSPTPNPLASKGIQVPPSPLNSYGSLKPVHSRCPGGAVQPSPDGSTPHAVPGCQTTSTPPGP